MSSNPPPQVRWLGQVEYEPTWQAMRDFNAVRDEQTPDELWVCEHPPVYTLGQAGTPEHLLAASDIPLVATDRGGQITYHGPGQIVVYVLVDLTRSRIKVRELVSRIEQAIIDVLGAYGVVAARLDGAPGVYVGRTQGGADDYAGCAKIAALGLRIRQGRSYHGLSLNVAMNLSPFAAINPCGYAGMAVTDLRAQGVEAAQDAVAQALVAQLLKQLEPQ